MKKTMSSGLKDTACRLIRDAALAAAVALAGLSPAQALTVGETYTVVVSKVNADGSLTSLSSTSATADGNGRIAFDLSGLPDASQTHFILLEVKDSAGNVVRQGIAPAPGQSTTNQVGVNPLSDVQAAALRAVMTGNHTDDPLAAAFGLVFIRSDKIASSDIPGLTAIMATGILGSDGMEAFLTNHGVGANDLATFRDRLIYNPAAGSKDLSDYVAYFKRAVDSGTSDDLAKAGGIMADIIVDAGQAAGIDVQLLLGAFDAAGDATGLQAAMASLSSGFQNSIMAAVSGFSNRLSSIAMKTEYSTALAALGGSPALIARFNAAVQAFVTAQQAIDVQYGQYFMDPQAYLAAHGGTTEQQVQSAIDTAFQNAWNAFQASLRSTDAEIQAMLGKVATSLGGAMTASTLAAQGVGQERDFNGNTVNWPIPQTVAVSWVADVLNAGGSFAFTRDTAPVPTHMQAWLDSDYNPANGIDGRRHDFTAQMPASFAALMGLMEDVQILEETRRSIWQGSAQPTALQRQNARIGFATGLRRLAGLITGTTDGSAPITAAEKKALLRLMMQPSLD